MNPSEAYYINMGGKSKEFVKKIRRNGFVIGKDNVVKLPAKNSKISVPREYGTEDFAYAGEILENRILIIRTEYQDQDSFYNHAISRLQKMAKDFDI